SVPAGTTADRLERPLSESVADAGAAADAGPGVVTLPERRDATPSRVSIAMIAHAYYDEDPRVRREAEALAAAGMAVDVFGLRRDGDPPTGIVDGVRVDRLSAQLHQGAPVAVYLREYLSFLARVGWALTGS